VILEFGMIYRLFVLIFDVVHEIIYPVSHLPTNETRFEIATFVRLLIFLPVILFLCCFAWVLMLLSVIEFFGRLSIWLINETASLIVRGFSLIRTLWVNLAYGSRVRNQSIDQHALWDRWLDGI
jgi:hypothetical protein